MLEDVQKIAVIGAGIMGHGIAQTIAMAGYSVCLEDLNESILARAKNNIQYNLQLLVDNEIIDQNTAIATLPRITMSPDLKIAVSDADIVIEAVSENLSLKQRLFVEISSYCKEEAILASNTSGLSITQIGKDVKHPQRVVGTHWWNPPYIIPLVEIIKGEKTSENTLKQTKQFLETVGKEPIFVLKDIPGFIGNRLQFALNREAFSLITRGVASAEDVDKAVKASFGFRSPILGPIETMDHAGLDTYAAIADYLYKDLDKSDSTFNMVKTLIHDGNLGLKTGKGLYHYDKARIEEIKKTRDQNYLKLLKIWQEVRTK
ncbi:MAG: 3-hydroxyacyl-CoA dehydrogenase family protein [Candidatus Hodarchaeota archaeon]